MRKRIAAALLVGALAAAAPAAAVADNPHAGGSGHFKGSAGPCKQSETNPNCPPFGG